MFTGPGKISKGLIKPLPRNQTLEELTKSVGVYFKKVSSTDDIDFYDHTGTVFIVGKDSRLMGIYSPPFNEKNIKNDITQLLSLND